MKMMRYLLDKYIVRTSVSGNLKLFGSCTSNYQSNAQNTKNAASIVKPNLRQAGKNDKSRNIVVAVCILVVIYMYPMIIKPLFGIQSSSRYLKQITIMIDPTFYMR